MQEISLKVEIFSWEMRKQKNRLTPVKIESKNQANNVVAERRVFGWEVPIEPRNTKYTWIKSHHIDGTRKYAL